MHIYYACLQSLQLGRVCVLYLRQYPISDSNHVTILSPDCYLIMFFSLFTDCYVTKDGIFDLNVFFSRTNQIYGFLLQIEFRSDSNQFF